MNAVSRGWGVRVGSSESNVLVIPSNQTCRTSPESEKRRNEAKCSRCFDDSVAVEILANHAKHESHHPSEEQEDHGDGGAERGEAGYGRLYVSQSGVEIRLDGKENAQHKDSHWSGIQD